MALATINWGKKWRITFSPVYDVADFATPDKGFATAQMPPHRSSGTRPWLAKWGEGLAWEWSEGQATKRKQAG
jgi:hypothetical protein